MHSPCKIEDVADIKYMAAVSIRERKVDILISFCFKQFLLHNL